MVDRHFISSSTFPRVWDPLHKRPFGQPIQVTPRGGADGRVSVQEMKEDMALQNQAKKWLQVVKVDGVM